jgi:hypothetical protein
MECFCQSGCCTNRLVLAEPGCLTVGEPQTALHDLHVILYTPWKVSIIGPCHPSKQLDLLKMRVAASER